MDNRKPSELVRDKNAETCQTLILLGVLPPEFVSYANGLLSLTLMEKLVTTLLGEDALEEVRLEHEQNIAEQLAQYRTQPTIFTGSSK